MPRNSIPHENLIVQDSTIEIDSIFQFTGGFPELNQFLNACATKNCTVFFANEHLTAAPGCDRLILNIYASIAADPRIAESYITYLMKLGRGEIHPI